MRFTYRRFVRVAVVALVGSLLLAVSGCNLLGLVRGPSETVESFYSAVEEGEIEAAIELLSARVTNQTGEEKLRRGLAQQTRQINQQGGITSVEIIDEEVIGETAVVKARVRFGNGQMREINVDLVEENSRWKIDSTK